MKKNNIIDATDKLTVLYNKINFISKIIMYMNYESYTFNSSDIWGFGVVLDELQNEIEEIKELINQ